MRIIIEGINRTEFCKPKSKDIDRRRFFETHGMLYKAYPEQMTRLRLFEYGKEVGTDSAIVYQENCIRPTFERGTPTTVDKLLADVDEHKVMTAGVISKRAWGSLTSKNKSAILQALPLVLMGAVLLWAFYENGFQF